MRKKMKDSGGFTMVEMLCAVAILTLLCLIISTCLSMALRAYRDITAKSETELLLNDLSDALADKLRYAIVTETEVIDELGNPVTEMKCSVGIVEIEKDGEGNETGIIKVDGKALLPDGAYGSKLANNRRYKVTTAEATPDYTGPTPVFEIMLEVEDTWGPVSAGKKLTVRCLNPIKKEEG